MLFSKIDKKLLRKRSQKKIIYCALRTIFAYFVFYVGEGKGGNTTKTSLR